MGETIVKYKYLDLITAFLVAVLLISNIASTKIVQVGTVVFDGGTLLFPLSYIFGDILTEVYGYSASRRVIWTGFVCVLLASITLAIVDVLPADPAWGLQDAFHSILGQTMRIVIADLTAYFFGEFANSFVLAKMKIGTNGRFLWTRTIGSTLVGEGLDTIIFITIAFYGTMDNSILLSLILFNYIFKVGVEVLFTPVTYAVVAFLKRAESEDYYDYHTNFNPILLRLKSGG